VSNEESEFREAIVEACRKFDVSISGDSQGCEARVDGVKDKERGWMFSEVGPDGWKE
jgi:hypothetical protein